MPQAEAVPSTLEYVRGQILSSLWTERTLLDAVEKGGHRVEISGGKEIIAGAETDDHSQTTTVDAEGTEVELATRPILEDPRTTAVLATRAVYIGNKLLMENQGQAQVLDVYAARIRNSMEGLADDLEQKLVANPNGAASGPAVPFSGLITLNGFAAGDGVTTGVFEGLVPASQTNTVSGIQKSVSKGWYHQYQTAGGAFNTNGGRYLLGRLIKTCRKEAPMRVMGKKLVTERPGAGGKGPHLALGSQDGYFNLERALGSLEAYNDGEGRFGYGKLLVDNCPVDFSMYLENDGGATVNIPSFYILNFDALVFYSMKGFWFSLGEETSAISAGKSGKYNEVLCGLAVLPQHLKSLGILSNGDTY
jgi:hypothetical protein